MEMVDMEESMSEWRRVYFSVLMSSVRGARKATFFAAGNIGLVGFLRCVAGRDRGLLERIDGRL